MAKTYPAISVIMPVLNEQDHLAAAVESVLSQNYPGKIELLLCLGPSTDSTNQIAAGLALADPRIRPINNPRGLTTVGLNEAIRQAQFDIIIRIDAHSEPTPGYFQRGVEILDEQKADLLGGIMDARGKASFQSATAWAYTSRFGIGGAAFHVGGEAGEAESAYLGIFRKSALIRVGGYDEAIIRGEDWDLAQRIKKTGGLVWFSPELRVVYWPRGRFDRLVKQFYSTGVWRGDLTRRDLRGAPKRYFAPPLLVASVIIGLVAAVFGWLIGILPTAAYLLGVAGLAVTASTLSLKARVALMIVLPTMHFSWGWGFWVGLLKGASGTIDRSRVTKKS
jgi:glycosyltransferase involved in cell wall biosynthesis